LTLNRTTFSMDLALPPPICLKNERQSSVGTRSRAKRRFDNATAAVPVQWELQARPLDLTLYAKSGGRGQLLYGRRLEGENHE
jgi:hypothetical protein